MKEEDRQMKVCSSLTNIIWTKVGGCQRSLDNTESWLTWGWIIEVLVCITYGGHGLHVLNTCTVGPPEKALRYTIIRTNHTVTSTSTGETIKYLTHVYSLIYKLHCWHEMTVEEKRRVPIINEIMTTQWFTSYKYIY